MYIPTEKQFKKLQKLLKHLASLDQTDSVVPEWLYDMDKIYYDTPHDEWESFIIWAKNNKYDWAEKFKESNKLWKKYRRDT